MTRVPTQVTYSIFKECPTSYEGRGKTFKYNAVSPPSIHEGISNYGFYLEGRAV